MPAPDSHGCRTRAHTWSMLGPALLALAACGRTVQDDEMRWAQAAIERNDRLEIVATDADSGTFTVRVKETGELRMIRASEVMAAVPSDGTGEAQGGPENAAAAPAADARLPEDLASTTSEAGSAANESVGSEQTATESAQIRRDDAATVPNEGTTAVAATPGSGAQPPEASDGGQRVIAQGPGYSITATGSPAPTGNASGVTTARPAQRASSVPLERRDDPLVCQGARFLRIDNRNIEFAGNAISAEQGCELHITNSRIVASGVGIQASGARVHIRNSTISGRTASVEATDGAQVYAQYSTFQGVPRWLENARLHDQGGNSWE